LTLDDITRCMGLKKFRDCRQVPPDCTRISLSKSSTRARAHFPATHTRRSTNSHELYRKTPYSSSHHQKSIQ
jgi:hypothetical protein